jgi:hypothetical protein
VRLRFTGFSGTIELTITVTHQEGDTCTVNLKLEVDGPAELSVDLLCKLPPPPDAGAPLPPDAAPELPTDASGPSPECLQYCTVMRDKCPGVYASDLECTTTCRAFGWTEGAPGNAQDTLACRIGWAVRATQPDDPVICRYAGPGGGNVCGMICRNLCDATARVCRGALPGGTLESCYAATCDPSMTASSETLDCRFHALTVAAMDGGQSCARLDPKAPDQPCP